jgi:hypothetical protein
MPNSETHLEPRSRPLPGTGRLGVVSAYFTLYGLASAAITVGIAAAVLVPGLGWRIVPANPWIAVPGSALLTFGFWRTMRLLRERKKDGAVLAAMCLASSTAASLYARETGWLTLGIPFVGLGLLVSVWRHLES